MRTNYCRLFCPQLKALSTVKSGIQEQYSKIQTIGNFPLKVCCVFLGLILLA